MTTTLRNNMIRLYINSTVALMNGAGLNSGLHVTRRNHARHMLMTRGGYTQPMMTTLHARATRQGEAAR